MLSLPAIASRAERRVKQEYTYPCPCGDEFRISHTEIMAGVRLAPCPSCTLRIRIKATDAVIDAMHNAVTG